MPRPTAATAATCTVLVLAVLAPIATSVAQAPAAADTDRVLARTRATFAQFGNACSRDGTTPWGRSLCGGVLGIDREARRILANRRDSAGTLAMHDGIWHGPLAADLPFANTAVTWGGTRWATVVLPLPSDDFGALALVAHESFHRLQPELGVTGLDALSPHLDERDGRLWLRLELRALAYALTTSGTASRAHARAALRFRSERQRLFPGSAAHEDALERMEGSAEYSGMQLATANSTLGPLRVVRAMDGVERNPSLVRSFAYGTGPALGLLLDRWSPGWQRRFVGGASMASLLRRAVGEARDASVVELARPYGYASVFAAEEERAVKRATTIARYRERLVTGPRLVFPADGVNRSFDPNELVPLDSSGTIYPTGTFQGPWGTLEVSDGALLSADYRALTVRAPDALAPTDGTARHLTGDGWTLDLLDGWVIAPASSGVRGTFEVRRR